MINSNIIASPVNKVNAKVELYEGSTLVTTCTCNDRLQDFTVERVGQSSKFFGFGVFHKITINLIDLERDLTVTKANTLKISMGYDEEFVYPFPTFYVSEVRRDEYTNTITVIAYDKLGAANESTVADLALDTSYTIKDMATACGAQLGINEVVCGKNLWDNSNYETYIPSENITKTDTGFIFNRNGITGGRAVNYYIQAKAGETYTFSYDVIGYGRLYIYKDRVYGTVLNTSSEDSVSYTFEEDTYAAFSVIINDVVETLDVSNIQIERSAVRTAYEPYLAVFNTSYPSGANFDGTELCKDVLNQIAEATQTIYFLNYEDKLVFKRLDKDDNPVLTISRDDYYDLVSGENRKLTTIVKTTELGDNVSATTGEEGVTQYVRDNPFWDLRDDIDVLLEDSIAAMGGIQATQFVCNWDGNFLLEIGDKIALTTEDDGQIISYMLNDALEYMGAMSETTQWTHETEDETASNPVTLGEKLKQTYARVDKANKEITLLASEVEDNKEAIAALTITTDGINASVKELETKTETLETNLGSLSQELVEEIGKAVTDLETDLGELSGKVTTNTSEIGELKVSSNEISAKVSEVTTKTVTLESELNNTKAKVTANETKIGELTTTTESISASVSSLQSKTTELENKDGQLESSITTNTEAIGELQVTTESINASVSNLETTTNNISGEIATNRENIAALQITTEGISASVSSLETTTNARIEGLDENYESLAKEVSLKASAEDIIIAIDEERQRGTEKVTTSTGFTFDSEGLTISKSDSEISTNINEDGLSVFKGTDEVLTADNEGVKAKNLHATTYLLIGENTYFADFTADNGQSRAGCFWTGK